MKKSDGVGIHSSYSSLDGWINQQRWLIIPTMLLNPILTGTVLFVLGACIGSFLNVIIWRSAYLGQPVMFGGKTAGLSLSWPPSHCPHCNWAIRWYQNIPVLAWVWLRGRCAKCQAKIPVRYPLVELATGLAFVALYVAYFHTGWGRQPAGLAGAGIWHMAAAIFGNGAGNQQFRSMFNGGITLGLDLLLVAVLFAASGIDADWYEIPTALTNILIAAALLTSLFGLQPGLPALNPSGMGGRMAVGGTAGLLVSLGLLWRGVLPRSFSQVVYVPATDTAAADSHIPQRSIAPMPGPQKSWPSVVGSVLILLAVAASWLWTSGRIAALLTLIASLVIFLLGVLPRSSEAPDESQQVLEESAAPRVRVEILKELLFLMPPVVLALAAAIMPFSLPHPEWLQRLLGVLLGLLFGGGVIWLTRISGSLAFNRVAMGLGDVHLMAAIGAVVGAKLVLPIFFMAPVLGLLWAIVLRFMGKRNVLPYGPWLSMATILALLVGWPIEHWYLLKISGSSTAPVTIPTHWPGTP